MTSSIRLLPFTLVVLAACEPAQFGGGSGNVTSGLRSALVSGDVTQLENALQGMSKGSFCDRAAFALQELRRAQSGSAEVSEANAQMVSDYVRMISDPVCGGSRTPIPPPSSDAGMPDSGPPPQADSGPPPADAGSPPDAGNPPPAGGHTVIIYGAEWCGACRSAKRYFDGRSIAYTFRNVDDQNNANEMYQRAQAQGLSPRGIPVLEIDGQIMLGFSQSAVERALGI